MGYFADAQYDVKAQGYFACAQYDVLFALPGDCFVATLPRKDTFLSPIGTSCHFPRRRKQEAIKGERAVRHFENLRHNYNFYTAE